jgi:hypothetical protein
MIDLQQGIYFARKGSYIGGKSSINETIHQLHQKIIFLCKICAL